MQDRDINKSTEAALKAAANRYNQIGAAITELKFAFQELAFSLDEVGRQKANLEATAIVGKFSK